LTTNFDKWDKRCKFVFGIDARQNLIAIADSIPEEHWDPIFRKSKYKVKTKKRKRPENVKERIVKERGYKNIRTISEQKKEI